MLTGLTLLFTAFGIMSLLMYILLFTALGDQQTLLLYVTSTLIVLAVVVRVRARRSTLLRETLSQLREDVLVLTGNRDE